jgi:squalene-associated FAD-dependent desaturase
VSGAFGQRVAVIGGGWAGIAAAVEAVRRGHRVSVHEMAPQLGGRARGVEVDGRLLDNGQHILIGAYADTLALMQQLEVDVDAALLRTPLRLSYPDGSGLQLKPGSPVIAFAGAVARYAGWSWRDKTAFFAATTGWALQRFDCEAHLSVAQLTASLPAVVREQLLDPLCIAALNTPSSQASARVFLRVLKDALFTGPGSADLLLPRTDLSALLPLPARQWLEARNVPVYLSSRVKQVERSSAGWTVDGEEVEAVILATTASEAARLAAPHHPGWARQAEALRYEPIVTVYAQGRIELPTALMALHSDATHPAQFVFDLGALRGQAGLLAFVISGAAPWVEAGLDATVEAVLEQGRRALGGLLEGPFEAVHASAEKRATFLCTPGMERPPSQILPGLAAAGDYIDGPYPATLEGAVRAGRAAVTSLG